MDRETIRDMVLERDELKEDAKWDKEQLRFDPSFDTSYWIDLRKMAKTEIQATLLSKMISKMKAKENSKVDKWALRESEIECQKLFLLERALRLDIKLYEAQAKKTRTKEGKFDFRRPYLQLSIGGESGLGIKNRRGRRDGSLLLAFRADLILKMGSKHPNRRHPGLWCPVTHIYLPQAGVRASHLFPWKCGEATMKAIFGLSDSGHSELFKAENGILWAYEAEELLKGGHLVIVPDIPNHPTQQQVVTWEASEPKEYKIRVLNPKHPRMETVVWGTDKRWVDLDNQRLQFKTNFRPRAKYLYFAYCEAMLCHSFRNNLTEVSSAELGKNLWGIPGDYMPERMLLGFVEEMGPAYEHLLEGAIKEDKAVVDVTALAAASTHIQEPLKLLFGEDTDEEEDTDDDEDFYLSILFDPHYFIF